MALGILLVVLIVLFQVCFLEHISVEDFIVADLADMTIIETVGI
jgi:hypothetical protein